MSFYTVGMASAHQVYKYKDENGKWVFSDIEPLNEEAETIAITAVKKVPVKPRVMGERVNGHSTLKIENPFYAPIEVELMGSVFGDTPYRRVIPGLTEETLYSGKEETDQFQLTWVFGDPRTQVDRHIYRLPLPQNNTFLISQSFNGGFSHTEQPERYAVDFGMQLGTSVHAARSGVIFKVKEDYNFGGVAEYFLDKANYLMILHDDGTYGIYAHILSGSVIAGIGDRVEVGQKIARSGNSGFSTGAHLHFVVVRNVGLRIESIPFQFLGEDGKGFTPQKGMMVKVM